MCGIIACQVPGEAVGYLVTGLSHLEYRGYDSAGIAVSAADGSTAVFRTTQRVAALDSLVDAWEGPRLGAVGIGHTRWATHGGVSVANAHPHQDCQRRLSIVHNGIIDNAQTLREELEQLGHHFASDVDSEVICHLVEEALPIAESLPEAVTLAVRQLAGSWAFVVLDAMTDIMVATVHRSPLLLARSDGGVFLASDISAVSEWVDQFQILNDGDVVEIAAHLTWTNNGSIVCPPHPVACPPRSVGRSLDRSDHMAGGIEEQPEAAARILESIGGGIASGALWDGLGLEPFDRIRILACGTSLNAGQVIGSALSRIGGLGHDCVVASEAAGGIVEPGTLTMAISQSGETADVLRAVEESPDGTPLLALVNNVNSTLARSVDAVLGCAAGAEIGVAATKTFVCQILVGTGLMISALVSFGRISAGRAWELVDDLYGTPERISAAIASARHEIPSIATEVREASGFVFLGRGAAVPYAMEGALKLKELTYRWAEAYPAGELKHGPLALIENGTPVVVVDDGDPRLPGNLAEVRARGAGVIRVGQTGSRIEVPLSGTRACGPLETVVPLQMLALTLATELGLDVDKPRNLAKSVTVD